MVTVLTQEHINNAAAKTNPANVEAPPSGWSAVIVLSCLGEMLMQREKSLLIN
jgi:hypothetical protein